MFKLATYVKILLIVGLSMIVFQLSCSSFGTRQVKDGLNPYQTVANSTAAIINPIIRLKNKDHKFFCSGYVVDGEYAITAAHCIRNKYGNLTGDTINIYDIYDNNTQTEATAVGLDDRSDLGLIRADFRSFKRIGLDTYGLSIVGVKTLISCGFPYGQKVMICVQVHPVSNYMFQIRGNGYLYPGMSGGPVIDAERGIAVGVNSAVTTNGIIVSPTIGILSIFNIEKK